jgi:protein-tyrosine phosphatase
MHDSIRRVLFVCTGNVCRSPMAAAAIRKRLSHLTSESAGVAALVGEPADPLAVEVMADRGIDLSAHRARQLTPELASAFELILVMEGRQQAIVEQIFPPARGRVHPLGRFGSFDVPDPYGQPKESFRSSLAFIDRGLDDFQRAFWSEP